MTSISLFRHGVAFDQLAKLLDFPKIESKIGSQWQINVEKGVEALASLSDAVSERFGRLKALKQEDSINGPEYRFNLARIAADFQLEKYKSGSLTNVPEKNELDTAIEAYIDAGEIGSGAIDLLASAILLPDDIFKDRCDEVKHHLRTLSWEFDLPKGAIALRQQIIHAADEMKSNPGGSSATEDKDQG